jgi:hypothetical protein
MSCGKGKDEILKLGNGTAKVSERKLITFTPTQDALRTSEGLLRFRSIPRLPPGATCMLGPAKREKKKTHDGFTCSLTARRASYPKQQSDSVAKHDLSQGREIGFSLKKARNTDIHNRNRHNSPTLNRNFYANVFQGKFRPLPRHRGRIVSGRYRAARLPCIISFFAR